VTRTRHAEDVALASALPRSWSGSLLQKYLEPGESLAEILFGLIMTLTFTLGAGLIIQEGPDAVRELLIATIGCNIAWGVIDGALYITGQVFERARLKKVGNEIRAAADERAAARVVDDELDELFGMAVDPKERDELCLRMARFVRAAPPREVRVHAADFKGAFASFWLVFFASLPAALPFMFFDDAMVALRVSNAVLIGLLFLSGYLWAHYTALKPWRTGFVMMFGGLAMVALSIALGG
jgi:VIT1/CCC1 family predicted Fe2+/Mn2+ transporter